MTRMSVWCSIFFGYIHSSHAVVDDIDRSVRRVDSRTHEDLNRVTDDSMYSMLRTEDIRGLRFKSKCGLLSCLVRRHSIFGEKYINLLEVREAYTGYRNRSAEVWRRIGEVAREDRLLSVLLSGIHYSVSTHISSFYRRFFTTYIPNPSLFLRRFSNSYRMNFYFTYMFVRQCVGSIELEETSDVDRVLLRIIRRIREDGNRDLTEGLQVDVDGSIRRVEEIIGLLGHVDCEKCQVWGKIQFEGLKTSLRILRGPCNIADGERFFIVNLLMRLSVSVRENIRLREYRAPCLMFVPLYWLEILVLAISVVVLVYGARYRTKRQLFQQ